MIVILCILSEITHVNATEFHKFCIKQSSDIAVLYATFQTYWVIEMDVIDDEIS